MASDELFHVEDNRRKGDFLELWRFFLLLLPLCAFADSVHLATGLILEGKVLSYSDGILFFDSLDLGALEIGKSRIDYAETEGSMELYAKGGDRFVGPVEFSQDCVSILGREVCYEDVVSIEQLSTPNRFGWTGRVAIDYSNVYGNTDAEDLKAVIEAAKSFDECRGLDLLGRFTLGKKDAETSEFKASFMAKYTHLFSKRWSWFVEQKWTHDRLSQLDVRAEERGGLLFHVLISSRVLWSLRSGAGRIDSWYTDSHEGSWSYLAGWNLSWKYWRDWTYEQHLLYTGSLQDALHYRIEAINKWICPLGKEWDVSVWHEWDFDHNPPLGTKNSDHTISVQLGYNW